ncbi:hypothetical protein GC098_23890 [Paenibacillus sp. LMG 31458]|uniref:Lamin tail domain-containing protein n=1 Tax=Paenibacillus phytorum TaxID=2654977 RepID=A0ABX1Y0M9_9BACL|nr:hypothetical protein [Paenibacillus phytorum]NOU74400.1 hypothetical protein [Paenibacillus phytorum]
MMKRKGFFLLYMFIASVAFGSLASVLEVRMAYASQEAGPVGTGYLLDEEFDFLDANGSATNDLKISGWEIETTGGSYSFLYYNNFKVNDNSGTESVTLKKRFVSQTAGKLTLEYRFKRPVKMDGVAWQLRNDDVPGFEIMTSGGNLSYQNPSGSPVTLQLYNANQEYGVKVVVDMDAKTADVYIDGAKFYFITDTDMVWSESKAKSFTISPKSDYKEYVVDMSTVAGWTGTLNQLRFDPVDNNVTSGTFGIDYITITNGLLNSSFESGDNTDFIDAVSIEAQ